MPHIDNLSVSDEKFPGTGSKTLETFRYAVDENIREIFLTEMSLAKDKIEGYGFVL